MSSVAKMPCELLVSPETWDDWKGKPPVIINATATVKRPTRALAVTVSLLSALVSSSASRSARCC